MRVEFVGALDDLVKMMLHALNRSFTVRHWRWLGGASAGFVLAVLFFFLVPAPPGRRISFAVGAFLGCVAMHWLWYPQLVRARLRRLRQYFRAKLGDKEAFLFEVEASPGGFRVKYLGKEVTLDWAEIKEIQVCADSVDVLSERAGLVVILKRAFRSESELNDFVEVLRRGLAGRLSLPPALEGPGPVDAKD